VPAQVPDIWRLHTKKNDSVPNTEELRQSQCKNLGARYWPQRRVIEEFRDGLPKVRRALANVATYMTFDDHEVTDDWNLNPVWTDRVMTSPFGRAIVRNGLLAFAIFQAWGNDPKKYAAPTPPADPTTHRRLLTLPGDMFPAGQLGPVSAFADEADELLGLNSAEPVPEQITWHFSVPGANYTVLGLDLRTRRGKALRLGAPENLSPAALVEQIPIPAGNADVVIALSSLTLLGPPVIDALLGPVLYKVFDIAAHGNRAEMPGLNPDAIEAWPNHELAFEGVLARLAPYGSIIVLSGDVHFATSASMTYFRRSSSVHSRFAQFTSSGMRNSSGRRYENSASSLRSCS
jgi:hypothetical protein